MWNIKCTDYCIQGNRFNIFSDVNLPKFLHQFLLLGQNEHNLLLAVNVLSSGPSKHNVARSLAVI